MRATITNERTSKIKHTHIQKEFKCKLLLEKDIAPCNVFAWTPTNDSITRIIVEHKP